MSINIVLAQKLRIAFYRLPVEEAYLIMVREAPLLLLATLVTQSRSASFSGGAQHMGGLMTC